MPVLSNEAPEITIHVGGNQSFVWEREPIRYIVVASDTEDGDSLSGSLNPNSVAVEFQYLAEGYADFRPEPADAGAVIGATRGKELVEGDDCLLCHSERATGPTAIPTYAAIAEKFQGKLSVAPALAYNIINGAQGIWGTMLMPAHSVTPAEANAMALYVLSFASEGSTREFLPISGTVRADFAQRAIDGPFGAAMHGRYLLSASYTDNGNGADAPLVGSATLQFRHPNVMATALEPVGRFDLVDTDGISLLVSSEAGASARLADIDLTEIRSISLATFGSARRWPGGGVELRLDAADGELVGSFDVVHDSRRPEVRRAAIRIDRRRGRHDLYLVVPGAGSTAIGAICFECTY
jgi:cytochrome c